jgi:transposase
LIDTLKQHVIVLKNQLESIQSKIAIDSIRKSIKTHEKQMEVLKEKLVQIVEQDEEFLEKLDLLLSIKGIGKVSAYQILSLLPDLSLFKNAKQFAAFIGVSPKQNQSGIMSGKTRMTKFGHARLRKALYMPVIYASLGCKKF